MRRYVNQNYYPTQWKYDGWGGGAWGGEEIFEIQGRFCKNAIWIPRDIAN